VQCIRPNGRAPSTCSAGTVVSACTATHTRSVCGEVASRSVSRQSEPSPTSGGREILSKRLHLKDRDYAHPSWRPKSVRGPATGPAARAPRAATRPRRRQAKGIRAVVCLTRGLPLVVGPPHPSAYHRDGSRRLNSGQSEDPLGRRIPILHGGARSSARPDTGAPSNGRPYRDRQGLSKKLLLALALLLMLDACQAPRRPASAN
jgi:hypothetical protein